MREAARALDDVSDHLGEVLRRADELLAEWSRFGAQVRTQVEHEVAAIGETVDGAVARAASTGIDRGIADRLRALTAELERLELRTRAASRAVVEQRQGDRRVLWIVVAGIVLANALLVALLLRKPDAAPVAEPIRVESAAPASPSPADQPLGAVPGAGAADPTNAAAVGSGANTGSGAGTGSAVSIGSAAEPRDLAAPPPSAGASAGSNAAGVKQTSNASNATVRPAPAPSSPAKQPATTPGPAKLMPSPIALPPRGGAHGHKKLP